MTIRYEYKYRLFLLYLWVPLVSYGQQQSITEVATDESGIHLSGTDANIYTQYFEAVTHEDRFSRTIAPGGIYAIQYEHIDSDDREVDSEPGNPRSPRAGSAVSGTVSLDEVVVSAGRSLTAPSLRTLEQAHSQIAGGVSLAVMQPGEQRLQTFGDALRLTPGVMVRETFGANDLPRLSIRGSGIQSNPQRRGIYLSLDGIPVNFADGSYTTSALDPSAAQYVEVLKGANALRYGAATLGGAINFISYTGVNAPGVHAKAEVGSHGYYSGTVRYGVDLDRWDFCATLSAGKQNGFRQHNRNEKFNLLANAAYRFGLNAESRLYVGYSYVDFDIPGPLTLDALLEDPTQVNPGVVLPYTMGPDILRDKPKRELSLFRVANRTAFRFAGHSQLTLAVWYQYADDRFAYPIALSTQHSLSHDSGIKAEWIHRAGNHLLTAGVSAGYGFTDRRGHINKDGLDSYMFSRDHLRALNAAFCLEDNWQLTDRLHLIAGLQAARNERNSEDVFPQPELRPWYSHSSHKYRYFYSENITSRQSFQAVNPRVGVIYNAGSRGDLQLFANVSRSYEPPTFDELVGTEVTDNINTSPKKLFVVELDKQTATTFEIGTRCMRDRYGWELSVYHSRVRNELLEVKDFVLGVKRTRNYPHTVHNGIELGWNVTPFRGIFAAPETDRLTLKGVYDYRDFRFTSDEYRGNRLAGVPRHFVTAALEYRYRGLGFVELNAEWQPEAAPVDHSNTLEQPPYHIACFRIGFDAIRHFTFYLDVRNVFNKYYAASYVINDQIHTPPIPFPGFGAENMAFFMPGPTRAWYAGVSCTF